MMVSRSFRTLADWFDRMKQANIQDIEFGAIDARHEILARDPDKRRLFLESFVIPLSFKMSDVRSGERYIIVGPKGSGKTAFLRYVQHTLDAEEGSRSRFIVFRDDVTAQDRDKIATLANFRIYDGSEPEPGQIEDCSSAWQLFIHREIATMIAKSSHMVAHTPEVGGYIKLLESFFSQFKTSAFKKLVKRITKGKIKVGAFGQGLEAEAEFVDSHGNLDVSEFVRYCNSVISGLNFSSEFPDVRFNIFFDEVNINFVTGAEFRKNAILVRDLITACGVMNSLFAENSLPIFVYSAIRSDVVDAVESNARELRKWIDDRGVEMNWYEPKHRNHDQPIIDLVRQRIMANEKRVGVRSKGDGPLDLAAYFDAKIFGRKFEDFLVFETWARPRDVVRMLSGAAKYVPRGGKFSASSFDKAKDVYSLGCWNEKGDELNSKYSQTEIDTIKRSLTSFRNVFTYTQFEAHITQLSNKDSRTNQFYTGRNLDVLFEDLFRVGVLGNLVQTPKAKFPAFQYAGHSNFSSSDSMCVHRSLWRELKLDSVRSLETSARKRERPARN